jgi:hypothetical protein
MKADARHDIGCDLRRAHLPVDTQAQGDEGRGADRNQHIRPQPGTSLPPLALGADRRREHKGDENPYREINQLTEVEMLHDEH